MMITRVQTPSALIGARPVFRNGESGPRAVEGDAILTPRTGAEEGKKNDGSPALFHRLQRVKSDFNTLAGSIRFADGTMEEIGGRIEEMKSNLTGIVKQYPPFPQGSEERVRLLKAHNGIRKLIDQLTFPPKEELVRHILADSGEAAGDLDIPVRIADSVLDVKIRRQPVHTGPSGFDLPDLPAEASDAEVLAALEKLDTAAEMLVEKRAGLFEDALALKEAVEIVFAGKGEGAAGMTEDTAELRSAQLREVLSIEPVRSLTRTQLQLVRLLS